MAFRNHSAYVKTGCSASDCTYPLWFAQFRNKKRKKRREEEREVGREGERQSERRVNSCAKKVQTQKNKL